MEHSSPKEIFVVDDEPKVLESIKETLMELNANVTSFTQASECLKALMGNECDLLITDINMPEMDGLTLLAKAKQARPFLLILVLTGYGDVPKAVKAMRLGAWDFIEKPLDEDTLLPVVEEALSSRSMSLAVGEGLTRREKEVLQLILEGKSNKEIANLLHRSVKTIEFHRYRMMYKLGAHNLAELVKRAVDIDLR